MREVCRHVCWLILVGLCNTRILCFTPTCPIQLSWVVYFNIGPKIWIPPNHLRIFHDFPSSPLMEPSISPIFTGPQPLGIHSWNWQRMLCGVWVNCHNSNAWGLTGELLRGHGLRGFWSHGWSPSHHGFNTFWGTFHCGKPPYTLVTHD